MPYTILQFEFKTANKENVGDTAFIWLHIDERNGDAEIPCYNGNYVANLLDMYKGKKDESAAGESTLEHGGTTQTRNT